MSDPRAVATAAVVAAICCCICATSAWLASSCPSKSECLLRLGSRDNIACCQTVMPLTARKGNEEQQLSSTQAYNDITALRLTRQHARQNDGNSFYNRSRALHAKQQVVLRLMTRQMLFSPRFVTATTHEGQTQLSLPPQASQEAPGTQIMAKMHLLPRKRHAHTFQVDQD